MAAEGSEEKETAEHDDKANDTAMLERLSSGGANIESTKQHLDQFATEFGLRTLVFAKRKLSVQQWEKAWSHYQKIVTSADSDEDRRSKKLAEAGDEIER